MKNKIENEPLFADIINFAKFYILILESIYEIMQITSENIIIHHEWFEEILHITEIVQIPANKQIAYKAWLDSMLDYNNNLCNLYEKKLTIFDTLFEAKDRSKNDV